MALEAGQQGTIERRTLPVKHLGGRTAGPHPRAERGPGGLACVIGGVLVEKFLLVFRQIVGGEN